MERCSLLVGLRSSSQYLDHQRVLENIMANSGGDEFDAIRIAEADC